MDNYGFTHTPLFWYIPLCGKKKGVSHLISYLVLHSEHKAEMYNQKKNFLTPPVVERGFKVNSADFTQWSSNYSTFIIKEEISPMQNEKPVILITSEAVIQNFQNSCSEPASTWPGL